MSERREQLSAYLDDALPQHEVDALASSDSKAASRYHMIGDAMRGELGEASMLDVSHQVREAIAHEPVPQADTIVVDDEKPGLFDMLLGFSSWLRPVGGLAVAASVALVAVVVIQTPDVDTGAPSQLVASEQSPQIHSSIVSVPVMGANIAATQPSSAQQLVPVNAGALERYLDEHSEFAARDTMQGRLPYVRAVGYKSQQ